MTLRLIEAPTDPWLGMFTSLPASLIIDNIEGIRDLILSPSRASMHISHYMKWLAKQVEPLLTDSRKLSLTRYPDTIKIYHLLLQLKEEGVDLSSISLSPFNGSTHFDTDEEVVFPVESYYGIEHALELGDEIIDYNLAKIATRVLNDPSLIGETDAAQAANFRAWVKSHPTECSAITYLSLFGANLTVFPSEVTSYLPNLNELILSKNQLRTLTLRDLPKLHKLSIQYNTLTTITLSGLPRLKALHLEDNQLVSLNLPELPKLESLHLANNRLTSLFLRRLPALKYLTLRGNEAWDSVVPKVDFYIYAAKIQELIPTEFRNLSYYPTLFLTLLYLNAHQGGHPISGPTLRQIHLSMHDLNVALQEDIRARILERYNNIRPDGFPEPPTVWNDDPSAQEKKLKHNPSILITAVINTLQTPRE